jgi:hypothetical protein
VGNGLTAVAAARLLPAFDPWVIGASRDAAALLDHAHRSRVYRAQGAYHGGGRSAWGSRGDH